VEWRGNLQRSLNFVFYNKQLTSGSPAGYSGRSNKRALKILKYNFESVKSAVDILSMYSLLKLLLLPQKFSFYTLTYLLSPWSEVLLDKLTSLCS
jgi:hypothetical protein